MKILKYQDQAGMVGSWYQTNTQFELWTCQERQSQNLTRSLLLGYIHEWPIMCMQIIIIISITTSREECSVNSWYPPHLEGEISHKLPGVIEPPAVIKVESKKFFAHLSTVNFFFTSYHPYSPNYPIYPPTLLILQWQNLYLFLTLGRSISLLG